MITETQIQESQDILDGVSTPRKGLLSRKYTQVPSKSNGDYIYRTDEYYGPSGAGYIIIVDFPDNDNPNVRHLLQEHVGPESRASGRSTYNINEPDYE